jgi:hypothetical protein
MANATSNKNSNTQQFGSKEAATVIQQVMHSAAAEGKRQATLTLYLFNLETEKGERRWTLEALRNLFKLPNNERAEFINSTLRTLSPDFASAWLSWKEVADMLKKTNSDLRKVQLKREAEESERACRAAYNMFVNALKACAALRAFHPVSVSMNNKFGVITFPTPTLDKDGKQKKDNKGTPIFEDSDWSGRALVLKGNEALDTTPKPRANDVNTNKGTAPGSAASEASSVLSKSVITGARKAIESAIASKAPLAPELSTERDSLLMTLLRSMFADGARINEKALHDWITAHNKATADNGVSVAATTKGPVEEGSKVGQPRTSRGS